MKYKGYFFIIAVFIFLLFIYLVKKRENFENKSIEYDPNFYSSDYHASEEVIREQNDHKMNIMYVKGTGKNKNKVIPLYFEGTQPLPLYNPPGTYKYNTTNYVPVYEDAIKLSKVNIERKYMIHPETAKYTNKKQIKQFIST